MAAKRSRLRFLDTYSLDLGNSIIEMSPAERRSLLIKCIQRIPDAVRNWPDVQTATKLFEEGAALPSHELGAMAEKADWYLAHALEAEELGDDAQVDHLHAVGCSLDGIKYLLRGGMLSEFVVDDCLYYLSRAMTDDLETVLAEGIPPFH
jgi:hypothetical protein